MEGGHAWQERRPLHRAVRILLECILVWIEKSKEVTSNSRLSLLKVTDTCRISSRTDVDQR